MSTRGIYTFKEPGQSHHVYVHHDNYPQGAAEKFQKALKSGLCWPLPRFEADEFAAGFIAANKDQPGNFRLANSRTAACDVEYGYTIWPDPKTHIIMLEVSATDFWEGKKERRLWKGPLVNFTGEL